jgi:NAD+ synthase
MQARFVRKSRKKIAQDLNKDIYMANLGNEKHAGLNKGKAFYRIKHRLRSNLLFYYSELFNLLFVGTSNKTEFLTGFFVKYGDNIADIMPLSFLYKTQVKILASHLGIDNSIIKKRPSPDLIPGIRDEDMLGLDYGKLDKILIAIEHSQDDLQVMEYAGASQEEIERVRTMILSSEYLRAWPLNL